MPRTRSALESLDPNIDDDNAGAPAPKRAKKAHEYTLSTDRANVESRARRAQARVEAAQADQDDTASVPEKAEKEMARMIAEAENRYDAWTSLVDAGADPETLANFQFNCAQFDPLTLPACFRTKATLAFFLDWVRGLFTDSAPHEQSGALRRLHGPDDVTGCIRFYVRFYKGTVEKQRLRSQQHVEGHMQDMARERPFQMSIEGRHATGICWRPYGGTEGEDDGGPYRRHLNDWKAAQRAKQSGKAADSTLLNFYMLTEFDEWEVFELVDLRIVLPADEAALPASLRLRRSKEAAVNETVLVQLLGPTGFNQSTGGERPLALRLTDPRVTCMKDKVHAAIEYTPPTGPSPVAAAEPDLQSKRDALSAHLHNVYEQVRQLPREKTGLVIAESAMEQAIVNATAFKLNKNRQVTLLTVAKDETVEGLKRAHNLMLR